MPGWIEHSSFWQWYRTYSSQVKAAEDALLLAEQYKIFTEVLYRSDHTFPEYAIITMNTVPDDAHSPLCCCALCVPEERSSE